MKIICRECGEPFEFTDGDIKFYLSKGYSYPKRCKKCRDKIDITCLGMKNNSFFAKNQEMGLMYPVEGGTTIERHYIISVEFESVRKYVNLNNNNVTLVEKERNATKFFRKDAEKISADIWADNESVKSVKLLPIAHYETLRELPLLFHH